jgi:uncharacterized protein (DUF2141 family)
MKPNFVQLLIFFLLAFLPRMASAQTIDLTITNLESSEGGIVLGIYRDQATFDKEEAAILKNFPKGANVSGSTLKVSFQLEPGVYGITLLDDANSDKKMNYNWLGMPKEGFGFSNYYHTGFSKPRFDSFKVTLGKGQRLAVTIKVRYL